jgi:hypothetical protein
VPDGEAGTDGDSGARDGDAGTVADGAVRDGASPDGEPAAADPAEAEAEAEADRPTG